MRKVMHLTEVEVVQLVAGIALHLPPNVKLNQTPYWKYAKQVQDVFGLVWQEDKKMFMKDK